jgi:hypothetical protein
LPYKSHRDIFTTEHTQAMYTISISYLLNWKETGSVDKQIASARIENIKPKKEVFDEIDQLLIKFAKEIKAEIKQNDKEFPPVRKYEIIFIHGKSKPTVTEHKGAFEALIQKIQKEHTLKQ